MPEESLYRRGWRQGSIFLGTLPLHSVVTGGANVPEVLTTNHEKWVVATQDCDLDSVAGDSNDPVVELRPVLDEDPPDSWGIRSELLKLDENRYVRAQMPRCHVSPAVLTLFESSREPQIAAIRTLAFKTWLGLRYDRPAVPDALVPLARKIAGEVRRKRRRPLGQRVRDVLMQFDGSFTPPRFSLYAVIHDASDEEEVREWLADIALSIPSELGVGDEFEAVTPDRVSLTLIETSYAADVSQLTWGGAVPPE